METINSPPRRVWCVDIGNMAPEKASQLLDDLKAHLNNDEVKVAEPDALAAKPNNVIDHIARAIRPEWFGERDEPFGDCPKRHILDNYPGQHIRYQEEARAAARAALAALRDLIGSVTPYWMDAYIEANARAEKLQEQVNQLEQVNASIQTPVEAQVAAALRTFFSSFNKNKEQSPCE